MVTPPHHITEAAAAVEYHFVAARQGEISSEEAKRRATEQIMKEPKWDITAGSVFEEVFRRAGSAAAGPQHYGSTVAPEQVRYYKTPEGRVTYRVGEAQPPSEFTTEIDRPTAEAIARAKIGKPLGVEELEKIAPERPLEPEELRALETQRQEKIKRVAREEAAVIAKGPTEKGRPRVQDFFVSEALARRIQELRDQGEIATGPQPTPDILRRIRVVGQKGDVIRTIDPIRLETQKTKAIPITKKPEQAGVILDVQEVKQEPVKVKLRTFAVPLPISQLLFISDIYDPVMARIKKGIEKREIAAIRKGHSLRSEFEKNILGTTSAIVSTIGTKEKVKKLAVVAGTSVALGAAITILGPPAAVAAGVGLGVGAVVAAPKVQQAAAEAQIAGPVAKREFIGTQVASVAAGAAGARVGGILGQDIKTQVIDQYLSTGVIKGTKTLLVRVPKGKPLVAVQQLGKRAIVLIKGPRSISQLPTKPQLVPIPEEFIPASTVVAKTVLEPTTGPRPQKVIELVKEPIPTQFDLFGQPVKPTPKTKEPITTMVGRDVVVDILKPSPPAALTGFTLTMSTLRPVFGTPTPPLKFKEIPKDIPARPPSAEQELIVYDKRTDKIRRITREDIRVEGSGFLQERKVFFRVGDKFVESERFEVLRDISAEAQRFRVGKALRPDITIIDTTKQKTLPELFKEGKKEISISEARKRLGEKKFKEIMGQTAQKKPPQQRPSPQELITVSPQEARTLPVSELLVGTTRVEPVFTRIEERFGFKPLTTTTQPTTPAQPRTGGQLVSLKQPSAIATTEKPQVSQGLSKELGLLSRTDVTQVSEQVKVAKPTTLTAQEALVRQEQIKQQIQTGLREQIRLTNNLIITDQARIEEQITTQQQLQLQEQLQLQQTPSLSITTEPTVTAPPPPPPPILTSQKSRLISVLRKLKEKGYDVHVKRKRIKRGKGKFIDRGYTKANKKPLTKLAAMGLGMELTDRYTNRSFRITKSKRLAVERKDLEEKYRRLKNKFRMAKRKRDIVERTKFAIDSLDEKRGIPYEAARLRKLGLIGKKRSVKLKSTTKWF